MTPQISPRGIADAQELDQIGIAQAALSQVVNSFGAAVELALVKSGGLLQQFSRRVRDLAQFPFQVFYTFAEGKAQRKLNPADEVSTAPAAVAIEQILGGIDIEGRLGLMVKRTESDELLPMSSTAGAPLPAAQVVQQREVLLEAFEILIHRAVLIVKIARTGQPPGHCGRRRCIATSAPALAVASAEGRRQRSRPGLLSALVLGSHIGMLPEERPKGNPDPSRASTGADTRVAGRDGPAVLRDSAGACSWRSGVAGDVLRHGKRGCNSIAPDHNADRSRTLYDIRCRGKCAAGELFRSEASCPPQTGAGQRQRIMAGLGPASIGDLFAGCQAGAPLLTAAGLHIHSRLE